MQAIINGRLVLANKVLDGGVLLFDKTIKQVVSRETLEKALAGQKIKTGDEIEVTDAAGAYVSPGFINLHIHGCAGADTMDGNYQALAQMSEFQASCGVTAFLPTTMTCEWAAIYRSLEAIRNVMTRIRPRRERRIVAFPVEEAVHRNEGKESDGSALRQTGEAREKLPGAKILGTYLEGPFISSIYKGAQKEDAITAADVEKLRGYEDVIRLVLLAPETILEKGGEAALEGFLQQCKALGILVSIGHSGAGYAEALHAIGLGAGHVTHLFNAMSGLHHRLPGVACAALDSNAVCELIADDLHVHPAMQRLAYRLKGAAQLELVTDSLRACGLPEGLSELGGQRVYVKEGAARLADGTLAGSVVTLDRAMANFQKNTGAPIWEIVQMVTGNQAQELGLFEKIGSFCPGAAADITIFDKDFTILRTYVDGTLIYKNPAIR